MEDWTALARSIGYADEKAMLEMFYIDKELPISEIAQRLGAGQATIAGRLTKHKIPKRPRGGANNTHKLSKTLFRMDQRLVFSLSNHELAKRLHAHDSTIYKYRRSVTCISVSFHP